MKNILVPIDFSDLSGRVIELTGDLAQAFGSTVRLLHVAAPDPSIASAKTWPQEVRDELAKELVTEHDELEALAARLKARGIETKTLLARGEVAETVLDYAARTGCDLIVLGAHRRGALAELLPGSVVKSVLRRTTCPVMVLPDAAAGDAPAAAS